MEMPQSPVYIFYLDPYIFIPAVVLLIVVIIASAIICIWIKRKSGSVGTPSDYTLDTLRSGDRASSSYTGSALYATIPHHKHKRNDPNPYASGRVDYFPDSDAWVETRTLTRMPHHPGIQGIRVLPQRCGDSMQQAANRSGVGFQETAFGFGNTDGMQSSDGYDKPPKGMCDLTPKDPYVKTVVKYYPPFNTKPPIEIHKFWSSFAIDESEISVYVPVTDELDYQGPSLTFIKVVYTNDVYGNVIDDLKKQLNNTSDPQQIKSINESLHKQKISLLVRLSKMLKRIYILRIAFIYKNKINKPCVSDDDWIKCYNNCIEKNMTQLCSMPYYTHKHLPRNCNWDTEFLNSHLKNSVAYSTFSFSACNCSSVCNETVYSITLDAVSKLYNQSNTLFKVYFADQTFERTTERYSYKFGSCLSDIGGNLDSKSQIEIDDLWSSFKINRYDTFVYVPCEVEAIGTDDVYCSAWGKALPPYIFQVPVATIWGLCLILEK
uniref:Uncharacterized protein n=1 Tax=Strigamia maritima TaxID=126957 RepID=T1IZ44_STRMM